jgi:hypothetical protein
MSHATIPANPSSQMLVKVESFGEVEFKVTAFLTGGSPISWGNFVSLTLILLFSLAKTMVSLYLSPICTGRLSYCTVRYEYKVIRVLPLLYFYFFTSLRRILSYNKVNAVPALYSMYRTFTVCVVPPTVYRSTGI